MHHDWSWMDAAVAFISLVAGWGSRHLCWTRAVDKQLTEMRTELSIIVPWVKKQMGIPV